MFSRSLNSPFGMALSATISMSPIRRDHEISYHGAITKITARA